MEELLKAYISIKEIGWIKDKENLEGLELIINKEKTKEAKEDEERRKRLKKAEDERKSKQKQVQKTIFGDIEVEKGSDEDTEEVINDNDCESNFFDEEEE